MWDALRLQRVVGEVGKEGEKGGVKGLASFMRVGCKGKGGGVS